MKKNLFLDLDGTLVDSKIGITRCVNHALEKLGHRARDEQDLIGMIGPPLSKGFPPLLGTDDETLIAEAIALYRERYDEIGIFESELFDGIAEVLELLNSRGCRMYLVTAKPEPYAVRILAHFAIDHLFGGVFAPTLQDRQDGKGHLIRRLLASDSLDHRESAMIGDRDRDIWAGRENSVTTVGVLWGYGSREELTASGADLLADSPANLLDVV